jgi:hypothetical protein
VLTSYLVHVPCGAAAAAARWYDRQGQVLVFITELLTDGSLRRFIRRKHAAGITLSALKRYAWQILQGLVYLHGHYPPIIHRWGHALQQQQQDAAVALVQQTTHGRVCIWSSAVTGAQLLAIAADSRCWLCVTV